MDSTNNSSFVQGDLIFAKVRGHPHWPATINSIDGKNATSLKYGITFFGTNETLTVNETVICPYIENKGKYGQPKIENFRNQKFNAALKAAEFKFQENTQMISESLTDNIAGLQEKIQHAQDADLETSLTLAAEVGNALLAENSKLRIDLHEMNTKNSQLIRLAKSNDSNGMKYQMEIDELEKENESLRNRNYSLIEHINLLEKQITKEKELRAELEHLFNNQDKEKDQIIGEYEKDFLKLNSTIKQLKSSLGNKMDSKKETKTTENSETQTTNFALLDGSSPLLRQIADIKTRQEHLENQMKQLQNELSSKSKPEMKTPVFVTHCTPDTRRSPAIQTRDTLSNKRKQEKKKNYFSVSLQVKKSKRYSKEKMGNASESKNNMCLQIRQTRTELNNSTGQDFLMTRNPENLKAIGSLPPLNAKPKPMDEDYNDFFTKNIEFYIQHMKNHYGYRVCGDTVPLQQNDTAIPSSPRPSATQPPLSLKEIETPSEAKGNPTNQKPLEISICPSPSYHNHFLEQRQKKTRIKQTTFKARMALNSKPSHGTQ